MILLLAALARGAGPGTASDPAPADVETGGAMQTVRVEVLPEPLRWAPTLQVRIHDGASNPRAFLLTPDPSRTALYTMQAELPSRRFRDVELLLDGETTLWRRVVPSERPDALILSFFVEQEGPNATRVAWLPHVGTGPAAGNEVALTLAFGWGALCFAYVAWLARRRSA